MTDDFDSTSRLERRTCCDCNQVFTLTERQIDWFAQRNLQLPRRCSVCLSARRERDRRAGLDQRVTR